MECWTIDECGSDLDPSCLGWSKQELEAKRVEEACCLGWEQYNAMVKRPCNAVSGLLGTRTQYGHGTFTTELPCQTSGGLVDCSGAFLHRHQSGDYHQLVDTRAIGPLRIEAHVWRNDLGMRLLQHNMRYPVAIYTGRCFDGVPYSSDCSDIYHLTFGMAAAYRHPGDDGYVLIDGPDLRDALIDEFPNCITGFNRVSRVVAEWEEAYAQQPRVFQAHPDVPALWLHNYSIGQYGFSIEHVADDHAPYFWTGSCRRPSGASC